MTDEPEWRATEEGFWSRVWFFLRHDRWPQRYIGQDDASLWPVALMILSVPLALAIATIIIGKP